MCVLPRVLGTHAQPLILFLDVQTSSSRGKRATFSERVAAARLERLREHL